VQKPGESANTLVLVFLTFLQGPKFVLFCSFFSFFCSTMTIRTWDDQTIAAGRASGVNAPYLLRAANPHGPAALARFFSRKSPAISRLSTTLAQVNHNQVLTLFQGKILTLTNPRLIDDGEGPQVIMADASNSLTNPAPVVMDIARLTGSVVSLVTKGEANEFGLVTSTLSPADISPHPDHIIDEITNGLERLHFGTGEGDAEPMFAAIPGTIIVPNGWQAPHMVDIMADPLPAFPEYPALTVWLKAMRYLYEHNGGRSFFAHNGIIFDGTMLTKDEFSANGIHEMMDSFDGIEPVTILHHLREAAAQYTEHMQLDAYREIGAKLAPPAPPEVAAPVVMPVPASTAETVAQVATILQSLQKAPKEKEYSLSDKERLAFTDDVMAKYKLAFAAISGDRHPDLGEKVLVLATFTEVGKKVLAMSNNSQAVVTLQQEYTATRNATGLLGALDSRVQFPAIAISAEITKAWRMGNLTDKSFNEIKDYMNRSLSILGFLTPDKQSAAFKARVTDTQVLMSFEVSDRLDKIKPTSSTNAIDISGKIVTSAHVVAAFASYRTFLGSKFEELDSSVAIRYATEFCMALIDPQGQEFCDTYVNAENPQIAANLLADLHNILAAFTAIANRAELRHDVLNETVLSARHFDSAVITAKTILNKLNQAKVGFDPTPYTQIPLFASFLPQLKNSLGSASASDKPTKDNNRQSGQGGSAKKSAGKPDNAPDPKRQKSISDAERNEANKAKGFLVWAGTGQPPKCPVTLRGPNDTTARHICLPFMSQGLFCPHQKCKHMHYAAFDRIPQDKRAEFDTYVKATNGLTYAPGKGPPSE
jgi:hypothetical protein